MRKISIDKEFRSLIFPLTEAEKNLLEKSLLEEGCREFLIIWRGKILDGHHRYEICNAHGLEFETKEAKVKNRAEAKIWIIKNQFTRRNLTYFQRSELALRLKPLIAEEAEKRMLVGVKIDPQQNSVEGWTQEELSKIAGVSHDTIYKVEIILEKAEAEQIDKLRTGEASINAVYNEIRRLEMRESLKALQLKTDEKYRIIYADPPWNYKQWLPFKYGDVKKVYRTMTLEEICEMPVSEITTDDAVLFLWGTSPKLELAFKVIKAWDFEYKTSFVWDKVKHNFGYYNSVRHEFLLIAGKGVSTPDIKKLYDSVVSIEKSGKHSEKPVYFRDLIDSLYTWGNRIELFWRGEEEEIKKGWDVFGNE